MDANGRLFTALRNGLELVQFYAKITPEHPYTAASIVSHLCNEVISVENKRRMSLQQVCGSHKATVRGHCLLQLDKPDRRSILVGTPGAGTIKKSDRFIGKYKQVTLAP